MSMETKEIVIIQTKSSDISECCELLKTEETMTFDGTYPSEKYLHELLTDNLCFVAKYGDEIVGCLFCEKIKSKGILLNLIVVKKEYRHKGIGCFLLDTLEKRCKEINLNWIVLYSTTKSINNTNFYIKNNYINKSGSFNEFGKNL